MQALKKKKPIQGVSLIARGKKEHQQQRYVSVYIGWKTWSRHASTSFIRSQVHVDATQNKSDYKILAFSIILIVSAENWISIIVAITFDILGFPTIHGCAMWIVN